MKVIRFTLNGNPVEPGVRPEETLVQTLRERLGLTGTKQGCDLGGIAAPASSFWMGSRSSLV